MKKFAFVNDAAEREYKALPADVQDDFGKDLRRFSSVKILNYLLILWIALV